MIVDNIFWDKQKFLMRLLKNTQTGILNIYFSVFINPCKVVQSYNTVLSLILLSCSLHK